MIRCIYLEAKSYLVSNILFARLASEGSESPYSSAYCPASVVKRLEELVNSAKKLFQEISVIDYDKAA